MRNPGRPTSPTTSRPSPPSTARGALRVSSAATEPRPRPGLQRSHPGRLDHPRDPTPTRRSLAAALGGARSAPAARLRSGRSPPAGPRTRIRPEAQARAKAAIQPHGSVQNSLPTFVVETVETSVVEPQAHALGSQATRPGDFTTLGPVWKHSNGGRAEKLRKERELLRTVQTSDTTSPFGGRRRDRVALNSVGRSVLRC